MQKQLHLLKKQRKLKPMRKQLHLPKKQPGLKPMRKQLKKQRQRLSGCVQKLQNSRRSLSRKRLPTKPLVLLVA